MILLVVSFKINFNPQFVNKQTGDVDANGNKIEHYTLSDIASQKKNNGEPFITKISIKRDKRTGKIIELKTLNNIEQYTTNFNRENNSCYPTTKMGEYIVDGGLKAKYFDYNICKKWMAVHPLDESVDFRESLSQKKVDFLVDLYGSIPRESILDKKMFESYRDSEKNKYLTSKNIDAKDLDLVRNWNRTAQLINDGCSEIAEFLLLEQSNVSHPSFSSEVKKTNKNNVGSM